MPAMNEGRFDLQLKRLARHYLLVRKKNDVVALVDLFHTLRVWTEIANKEACNPLLQAKTFRVSKLRNQRDIWKNGSDYFYISMANPCFGERFQEGLFMPQFAIDEMNADVLTCSQAWWPPTYNRPCGARNLYFGPDVGELGTEVTGGKTLIQFMRSKFLWFRKSALTETFSVQDVIERLSNGFVDASHFQQDPMGNNSVKEHVRFKPTAPLLQSMQSAGVPLTVFMALYIAQEILINLGKIKQFEDVKEKSPRPVLEFKPASHKYSYLKQNHRINVDPWLVTLGSPR